MRHVVRRLVELFVLFLIAFVYFVVLTRGRVLHGWIM